MGAQAGLERGLAVRTRSCLQQKPRAVTLVEGLVEVEETQDERTSRFRTEGKGQKTNLSSTEPLIASFSHQSNGDTDH